MNKAVKVLLSQAVNSVRLCDIAHQKCPNQIVGMVKIISKNKTRFVTWEAKLQTDQNEEDGAALFDRKGVDAPLSHSNIIIMVLESPHTAEFSEDGNPKGPAFGRSGFYINKFFPSILENVLNDRNMNVNLADGCYYLAIINAIRYQCSLGMDTLLFRDAVFLSKWEKKKYRNSFISNLKLLANASNNYLLVNCCTKGCHLDLLTKHKGGIDKTYLDEIGYDYQNASALSLKAFVSDEISNANISQYYCAHPSSWYSKRNRKINDHI